VLNLGVFLDLAMTDVFAIKIKSFEKLVEIAYQAKAPMSNALSNTHVNWNKARINQDIPALSS
jgi:hypothetical protein